MSNWCHNVITITGSSEYMKIFFDDLTLGEKKILSFERTMPIVEGSTAYDTWGTESDLDHCEVLKETKTDYVVRCDTASTPPVNWSQETSKKYKLDINIAYVECGNGFYGFTETKWSNLSYMDEHIFIRSYDFTYDSEGNFIPEGNLKNHMDDNNLISVGGVKRE